MSSITACRPWRMESNQSSRTRFRAAVASRPARQHRCRGSGACPRGAGCRESSASFHAPALPDQSQQGFWGGAQAGEELMPGLERLAVTGATGDQFNHPGRPWPVRLDVLWCLLGLDRPNDVTAVADLAMRCG